MGLALLWGAAQAALPKLDELTLIPGLNELALKESIRARVGSILQDNDKDASKLTLDAISIDKAEAVDVRGIKLYAVKLSLQNPEQPDGQRDEMTLLTESSGAIQFGMVSEIATGLEAALSQATEITKMELPERLSSPLLIGTGSHNVVFVSDPFCPYCRTAYTHLMIRLESIRTLRLGHLPLAMHPGADAAAWVMEHAAELNAANVSQQDVVRFAYTDLQAPDTRTQPGMSAEDAQKAVVEQFLTRFPALAPKSDAETYTFFLKGKFAAKTQAAAAEFQKYRITGTPAIVIDGQLISGFDRQAIDARLQARSSDSK